MEFRGLLEAFLTAIAGFVGGFVSISTANARAGVNRPKHYMEIA